MQTIRRYSAICALAFAAALAATAAIAAEPATGRVIQQELEYADLARYVGKTVTIRSKFNTTRTGELIKYTDNGLIIKLPARGGGMGLSMPRNTAGKVSAPIPVGGPFFTEAGADGAKKD